MSVKSTTRALKIKTAKAEKAEAPTPTPKPVSEVIFESAGQETHEMTIMGFRSRRIADRKLRFTVPAADADRFASHRHVVTGRVVRRG
jgi:hypothetical protein